MFCLARDFITQYLLQYSLSIYILPYLTVAFGYFLKSMSHQVKTFTNVGTFPQKVVMTIKKKSVIINKWFEIAITIWLFILFQYKVNIKISLIVKP